MRGRLGHVLAGRTVLAITAPDVLPENRAVGSIRNRAIWSEVDQGSIVRLRYRPRGRVEVPVWKTGPGDLLMAHHGAEVGERDAVLLNQVGGVSLDCDAILNLIAGVGSGTTGGVKRHDHDRCRGRGSPTIGQCGGRAHREDDQGKCGGE